MEGLIFRFQKVIEEVAAGNRSLFSGRLARLHPLQRMSVKVEFYQPFLT